MNIWKYAKFAPIILICQDKMSGQRIAVVKAKRQLK
jgi:hypothetical protein